MRQFSSIPKATFTQVRYYDTVPTEHEDAIRSVAVSSGRSGRLMGFYTLELMLYNWILRI